LNNKSTYFDIISARNRQNMENHVVNGESRTTLPPYLFEVAIGNRLGDRS
jgi:hypothetical protein